MKMEQLEYFLDLAESGSLNRTAEDKYVLVPVGLGDIIYLCLLPDQENMPQAVRQLLEAVKTVL